MHWLNTNLAKEDVVFGNDDVSYLIAIYTPLDVFFHKSVCCTTLSATRSRRLDALFPYFRLRGVDAQTALENFSRERAQVSVQMYGIYYRKLFGSYEAMPDDKLEEIVALYKETLSTPRPEWLRELWRRYEVEYIVWDTKQDPEWQLGQYPFLEEEVVFGDFSIYRVLP